jgi:ABC-type branched-subunit amino acid transport system ATPase component
VTPRLAFAGISHRFGVTPVLDDVRFEVPAARFAAVIGPSGCGNGTLLQMAAGLLRPSAGSVQCDGVRVTGVPPGQRHLRPAGVFAGIVLLLVSVLLAGAAANRIERRLLRWLPPLPSTGSGEG